MPWELPGSDGWTRLASGTVTDQITGSDGLLNLLTTGTATIRYSENLTSMGDRARVWGVVTASTGQADVELRWDDGVSRREVQLTIPATGPAVVVNDPAGVATTIITHGEITDPVEFMMEIDESTCKLWTRQWSASELRTWNAISSGAVTSSGAATGTGRVRFGALGATSDDVSWHAFAYSKGAQSGESLIDMTLPDDLRGFPIPSGPEEVLWIADGVWAWAVDGPASPGDEWLISTRYEYPIERIYPSVSPSPRLGWRSATATAGMEIAWREDTVSTAALGIRVLHLSGINFRQFQIQGRAGGMWLDLHTVENWIEFEYTRTGNTVKAGGAGLASSGEYLHHGEAVGGYLELSSTKVRKITHHTEGSLFQTGDRRQAQIVCDDMDDTEPTSGTARIWFPSVTVVMGPSGLEGWRIQIDDDASPVQSSDGYYQIGALFWGYVSYFATDYSFGRVKTIRPNTEITTARDGTRRSRVNGPPRRGVSFSFPAIDSTPFMAAGTPNNIETGPYAADHAVRDEPTRTDGIIEYIRGGDRPILYLPRIDKLELSPFGVDAGIHRARGTILGRVIGGVTMTSIAGDEETEEVLQIGTITIEEEV